MCVYVHTYDTAYMWRSEENYESVLLVPLYMVSKGSNLGHQAYVASAFTTAEPPQRRSLNHFLI